MTSSPAPGPSPWLRCSRRPPPPPTRSTPARSRPSPRSRSATKFHPRTTGMEPGPRLAGFARRLEMEKAVAAGRARASATWGPRSRAAASWTSRRPSAHPDALLVAFASGGLWRTDNRGGSWTPLFDRESSASRSATSPLGDQDGRTIYVGTGENNSSRTSYAGTGDLQDHRRRAHLEERSASRTAHHIGRIVVDAADPRIVHVAALGHLYTENGERGVYKSTDGGETWKRDAVRGRADGRRRPRPGPGAAGGAVRGHLGERAHGRELPGERAGQRRSGSPPTAARRGRALAGGLPAGATVGRIGLALAASRPETVYAVVDNQALRPESEPLDEETPPGELTARRLRALGADDVGPPGRRGPRPLPAPLRVPEVPEARRASRRT